MITYTVSRSLYLRDPLDLRAIANFIPNLVDGEDDAQFQFLERVGVIYDKRKPQKWLGEPFVLHFFRKRSLSVDPYEYAGGERGVVVRTSHIFWQINGPDDRIMSSLTEAPMDEIDTVYTIRKERKLLRKKFVEHIISEYRCDRW